MVKHHLLKKKICQLRMSDFKTNPIWSWAEDDDDESLVVPLETSCTLPDDHDAIFVASDLVFNDGTRTLGTVSVRMSDHQLYSVSFEQANGELLHYPLRPDLQDLREQMDLAYLLKKEKMNIFPIRYETQFIFNDGKPLKGKISEKETDS